MQTKFINRQYKHCDAENAAIYPNKMNKDKLLAKILLRVLFFYYIEDWIASRELWDVVGWCLYDMMVIASKIFNLS